MSEPSFQIGDKVRILEPPPGIKPREYLINEIGTVIRVSHNSVNVKTKVEEFTWGYYYNQVELFIDSNQLVETYTID